MPIPFTPPSTCLSVLLSRCPRLKHASESRQLPRHNANDGEPQVPPHMPRSRTLPNPVDAVTLALEEVCQCLARDFVWDVLI